MVRATASYAVGRGLRPTVESYPRLHNRPLSSCLAWHSALGEEKRCYDQLRRCQSTSSYCDWVITDELVLVFMTNNIIWHTIYNNNKNIKIARSLNTEWYDHLYWITLTHRRESTANYSNKLFCFTHSFTYSIPSRSLSPPHMSRASVVSLEMTEPLAQLAWKERWACPDLQALTAPRQTRESADLQEHPEILE